MANPHANLVQVHNGALMAALVNPTLIEDFGLLSRNQISLMLGKLRSASSSISLPEDRSVCRDADPKRVYYMSMEFLMGRSLTNALNSIGVANEVSPPSPVRFLAIHSGPALSFQDASSTSYCSRLYYAGNDACFVLHSAFT